jgi:hypothetical protein
VRLQSLSGRVEVAVCQCCGEVRVYVEQAQVHARPGPLSPDSFRAACRAASALLEHGDAEAAAELSELAS